MQNHRITTKPRDTTDDFDVFVIQSTPHQLTGRDKIGKCDFYMEYSTFTGYQGFAVVDYFNQLRYANGFGIRVKTDKKWVRKVFDVIDWREHAHKGMQGNLNLSKSDVVRGYEKYCDAYCWQID